MLLGRSGRRRHDLIGYRAVFNANAAARAQIHVDAPGPFPDLDLEIPGASLDRLKIRVSDELDVQMPADLDQFGGDNSHGTVIGGEGLVQLSHSPSDSRGFLEEIDVISRIRQIERRLHACNPPAHDQNRPFHVA
jgi:hypothetical protein